MSWNWKIQKCYLPINALVAQLVEHRFCKAVVASSSLVGGSEFYNSKMSLISQTDRQMVIEALEYYVQKLKEDNCTPASISAFQTLLNWVELEHFKHEN